MINPAELRKAQLIMLDMLIEFDAICKKHKLQYWLDSGTLLGAVRHSGFIPWDDDIDIAMPVEDYRQFLSVANDELSRDIFLQTSNTDKAFKFDYIKLRSNKANIVEFHEKDKNIEYHQGIFVDIFPMLAIENSQSNQELYDSTLNSIRSASAVSLHTPDGKDDPARRSSLTDVLQQKHLGWSSDNSMVIYGGEMPDVAAWFNYGDVFPLSSLEFEGIQLPVPKQPGNYLDAIYSFDYRQLPPEKDRVTHAYRITFT